MNEKTTKLLKTKKNISKNNTKKTNGVDKMKFIEEIDKIKKDNQETTFKYIIGLKFVTSETAEEVLRSIRTDAELNQLQRFVIYNNKIKLQLKNSNFMPTVYIFSNKEIMEQVVEGLQELGQELGIFVDKF